MRNGSRRKRKLQHDRNWRSPSTPWKLLRQTFDCILHFEFLLLILSFQISSSPFCVQSCGLYVCVIVKSCMMWLNLWCHGNGNSRVEMAQLFKLTLSLKVIVNGCQFLLFIATKFLHSNIVANNALFLSCLPLMISCMQLPAKRFLCLLVHLYIFSQHEIFLVLRLAFLIASSALSSFVWRWLFLLSARAGFLLDSMSCSWRSSLSSKIDLTFLSNALIWMSLSW